MRNWAYCLLLAWLWPAVAFGQVNVDGAAGPPAGPGSALTDAERKAAERLTTIAGGEDEPAPSPPSGDSEPGHPPPGVRFNEETLAKYQRAWQAYYSYRADGYTHRQAVFEWQDVSTKITFFVVIGLVLAGVYFAAVQFHVGMRAGRKSGEAGEVEISLKGIKVRSPVLGVIVLTISLAFFYLYLVYVYPIENVF